MIFLYFALLLGFCIWLADKYLGDHFIPYLKYAAILFVAIFISLDVWLFIETERFLLAKSVGGDLGITYTYTAVPANTTVENTMFDINDMDSGNVYFYHEVEHEVMSIFSSVLPPLAIFIIGLMVLQVLYLTFVGMYYGYNKKRTKDDIHNISLKDVPKR